MRNSVLNHIIPKALLRVNCNKTIKLAVEWEPIYFQTARFQWHLFLPSFTLRMMGEVVPIESLVFGNKWMPTQLRTYYDSSKALAPLCYRGRHRRRQQCVGLSPSHYLQLENLSRNLGPPAGSIREAAFFPLNQTFEGSMTSCNRQQLLEISGPSTFNWNLTLGGYMSTTRSITERRPIPEILNQARLDRTACLLGGATTALPCPVAQAPKGLAVATFCRG